MTDLSARKLLIPYLFSRQRGGFTEWYGVSAYSLDDARALLRQYGYDIDLADPSMAVRERVVLTDDERRHLGPNMGPMQLCGVWYPQHNLGDAAAQSGGRRDRVT